VDDVDFSLLIHSFFSHHVRILCTTRIQCRTTTSTASSSASILISAITATVAVAPLLSIHVHFMSRCLVLHACSVAGGLDVSRLEQVEALARDAAKNHMSPQEADNELVKIVAQKPMYVAVPQSLCGCFCLFCSASTDGSFVCFAPQALMGFVCFAPQALMAALFVLLRKH
jgi:uncharacterized membrane protein YjjP (DUF1212 family)